MKAESSSIKQLSLIDELICGRLKPSECENLIFEIANNKKLREHFDFIRALNSFLEKKGVF